MVIDAGMRSLAIPFLGVKGYSKLSMSCTSDIVIKIVKFVYGI